MDDGDRALHRLKEQMTEEQRQDMSDLLQAELKRRREEKAMGTMDTLPPGRAKSKVKSSPLSDNLGQDDLGDIYGNLNGEVKNMRLEQLERRLADAKKQQKRIGKLPGRSKRKKSGGRSLFSKKAAAPRQLPPEAFAMMEEMGIDPQAASMPPRTSFSPGMSLPNKNVLLIGGIAVLAIARVAYSSGVLDLGNDTPRAMLTNDPAIMEDFASSEGALENSDSQPAEIAFDSLSPIRDRKLIGWSAADKELLTQLDARRVELEQRSAALEQRETEVETKERALAERLAELRTLSSKLAKKRQEKDHRYEARLEQLANVYGSMAPKEAAPLIARLDDSVALALLERMPGKRMGQILALMKTERAIALTKTLTDKRTI